LAEAPFQREGEVVDKASNYTPKVPGTQPKAPSDKTKEKRAQLKKQHHARTLSLTSGIVKTEGPPKADETGWTDTMRRRFNILLDKLNAGSPSVSDLTAGVHGLFGKRGYQHGDKQIMADFVSQQPLERQMNIAKTTEALIPKTHDPLTKIVFNDIHDAAERAEHPPLFIPQDPPKVPPTLATSGPATVKTPQEPVRDGRTAQGGDG
jgi:hypothetical protein